MPHLGHHRLREHDIDDGPALLLLVMTFRSASRRGRQNGHDRTIDGQGRHRCDDGGAIRHQMSAEVLDALEELRRSVLINVPLSRDPGLSSRMPRTF